MQHLVATTESADASIEALELLDEGRSLAVTWRDGEVNRYHAIWLRDNAGDPSTRSPENGQKLIRVSDIPKGTHIAEARVTKGGSEVELEFLPEKLALRFDASFLWACRYDRAQVPEAGWVNPELCLWDSGLGEALPRGNYAEVEKDPVALTSWLEDVRRYGFAILDGGAVRSGALVDVVEIFGYVRETNYGRWFDVVNQVNPVNLAYTGLGLQAHTDNPYRDPVPTLQILYCLEDTVEGGESKVVDGFMAAQVLRKEDSTHFDLLSRYCGRFEYAGSEGVRLRTKKPMIELAPDGELVAIRFNNRSAAAITDVPYDDMADYYDAYRHMSEIVDRPELSVSFRLTPGSCFIVDNTRVMHARSAFSGTGRRLLQGCYADRDGLLSTLAAMREKLLHR